MPRSALKAGRGETQTVGITVSELCGWNVDAALGPSNLGRVSKAVIIQELIPIAQCFCSGRARPWSMPARRHGPTSGPTLQKLRAIGISDQILEFLDSWLPAHFSFARGLRSCFTAFRLLNRSPQHEHAHPL